MARYHPGMTITNPALVFDLLEWIEARPRTYAETLDAWRTSCPRLPVWEDAVDSGLVARVASDGAIMTRVTDAGRAWLATERSARIAPASR